MFWERFYKLCEKNSIKPNPLATELGISSGAITKWKNGGIPNGEMLIKIADHLNCSIDYLLGRTDNPNSHKAPVGDEYITEVAAKGDSHKAVKYKKSNIEKDAKEYIPPDVL